MSVQVWTKEIQETTSGAPNEEAAEKLAALFTLNIDDPQVSSLQNDIWDNRVEFENLIEHMGLYDDEWPGFIELCKSYLRFCRDVDPNDLVGSYDLYAQFMTDLQTAFSNTKGAILKVTVVIVAKTVVSLSLLLDNEHNAAHEEMIRTSYASSLLLKLFNSIRGEKIDPALMAESQGTLLTKKSIILFVATLLCRVYFKLGTPSSCANVFSNIHTAKIKFSSYSRADKVEYRYYLGRFYLTKNQLGKAYRHLHWAFDNCLATSSNKRLICQYLIPPAMLLGELPTQQLLQHFNLEQIYGPLVTCLRQCNYTGFMRHLETYPFKQWFLQRGIYALLKSRSMILFHRLTLYKLWKCKEKSSTIHLSNYQTSLMISMSEHPDSDALSPQNDQDHQNIESICISLISQGFVMAKIFPRNKALRLRVNDPFPMVSKVHNVSSQDSNLLAGHEAWMND